MSGWIKLHRDIKYHWVFQRDDYFRAWIFLILRANHQSNKALFSDILPEIIEIKRGEVVSSLRNLGIELKWTSSKVRRFLKKLEKDNMIVIHNEKRWTHLTILNYDTYQDVRNGVETEAKQRRNRGENNIRMKKKEKNEKKVITQKEQLLIIGKNLKELQVQFPNIPVKLEFDRMSDWLLYSGKKYKNYKAFFNNWLRKTSYDTSVDTENKPIYTYVCGTCNSAKDKSEYKDLFISCCDTQTTPTIM